MKKFFIAIATALALAAPAQVVKHGDNVYSAPKSEKTSTTAKADTIGAYWQDKDGRYPIYMGRKGGLYYYKVAKSGKHAGEPVRHYIPKEEQAAIKRDKGLQ